MRTTFKLMLAAGAVATFLSASAGRVDAEPVVSSWYGSELEGSPTASGEPFRAGGHTAAHRSLPLGTELLITYGGQQTVVRVNDRGPHVDGRDIDLSQAAAEEIGLTAAGSDAVDVRALGDSAGYGPSPTDYDEARSIAPTAGYEVPPPRKSPRSSVRGRAGVSAFLRERPYLKVLGASFVPNPRSSTGVCQEASMTAPTPTAGTRLPSVESARARVVAAVPRCSPAMRVL